MADLDFQETLDFKPHGLDFQASAEPDSPIKAAMKKAAGAGEAGLEAIPKMVAGAMGFSAGYASDALSDIVRGNMPSHEKAMTEAERRQHQVTDWRYFDEAKPVEEAISKGFDTVRDVAGRGLETIVGQAINPALRSGVAGPEADQPLARTIGEAAANFIPLPLAGRGRPKERPTLKAEEPPIRKGPEGAQGGLDFQEGPLNPPTMEGQPNRSPYNLPQTEVERLERELNPPTEQRVNGQGELFTGEEAYTKDELQARRFQLEEAQGGGRFKTPNTNEQVAHDLEAQKGFGGATEQSNLSADLFEPKPQARPDEGIPYKPHLKYGQTAIGRKQGGVIDPDLLTLGVSKLLKSEGFQKTMEKFKGTFSSKAIREAIKESNDPASHTTIVFMSPKKFLELAMKRLDAQTPETQFRETLHRENKREPIRSGLKTKEGLEHIPELYLSSESGAQPGATVHSVWAHEGRHRADVFAEQGLELMPVRVQHNDITWGRASQIGELPRKVISENGVFHDFPQPENWKPENDLDFTNKGKFGQAGAINFGPKGFGARAKFKEEMDKSVEKKGLVPTLLDARKQFQMERRDLPQIIKEEGIQASTLEDLTRRAKGMSNLAIDRTMSILTESKGGLGKIIKWAVDNISEIERKDALASEKDLFGEKYKPGLDNILRPFEKRVRGEEGILSQWKDAHKAGKEGRSELRNMLDVAIEKIGQGATRDDFKSEKQFKIYEAVQNGFENIRNRVNDARAKSGLPPIKKLPGFLPSSWEGDYRVHMYDGLDNHVWSEGFNNVWQAKLAVKALRQEHPDVRISDPQHITMDRTDIGDLSAFTEAVKLLGKDDPVTKAIQKTMVQLRSSRGFGRHGLQKTGVLGFLGMQKGDLGVRNMERATEQYVRQANRYISNMEKARLQSQLDGLPIEFQKAIPRGLEYLQDYIDNSRGKDIDRVPIVKDLFAGVSEWAGMGQSAPLQLIRQGSMAASLYFLTTSRFAISQLVQNLNAIPKYMMMNHEGTFANPIEAVWKGWEHFVSPDKLAMDGANWAQREGHLDSALVAMMDMKFGDVATQRMGLLKDAVSVSFGKLEKNAVRLPVFLAMEYGLRESMPDHTLRYETAANMMDYYMVHYSESSRPLLYGKLGLVGDAVKQFKQYSHNSWGALFEYMQYGMKKGGSWAPLVAHLAVQTSLSGLKGATLVTEATAAVAVFNALAPALNAMLPDDKQIPHIPSPVDWLMNSKLHDVFVFGGLSTALGYDISSSVNAPNVPQMFSAPGIELPVKALVATAHWAMNKLAGVDTEQDLFKAAMADSPSLMHGWLEELFSKPGEPAPMQGQKDLKGNYIRNANEKLAAKILSVKSISEARINGIISAFKKEMVRDLNSKVSALDAIVDRVSNGKSPDPKLIKDYVTNGGDLGRLHENIVRRIQERHMDFSARQMYNKQLNPAQIHKLNEMKALLDRQEQNRKENQSSSSSVRPMGLGAIESSEKPTGNVVSDSEPRPRNYMILERAKQIKKVEQMQNRLRFNNTTSGKEIEDAVRQDRINRERIKQEEEDLMKAGQRMKNRIIQM